jgi:hypothetical protein
MRYFEAPTEDISFPAYGANKSLFIAGGITGCRDWQTEFANRFRHLDLDVFNPRRDDYPDDPEAVYEQIAWEHRWLKYADAISFWFAEETVQPITLLELGRWLGPCDAAIELGPQGGLKLQQKYKRLFIGIHPNYSRKQDVEIQVNLERQDWPIHNSLDTLAEQVEKWATNQRSDGSFWWDEYLT